MNEKIWRNRSFRKGPLFITTVACSVWFGAVAAAAQDGGAVIELSPITVVGQEDTGYAADRAISATRTSADRDDVPLTVDVINRDVIEDQGGSTVGEVLRYVPGLTTTTGAPGGRFGDLFASRGFNSNFVKNGQRRGRIGLNSSQELANVERIEVVKGPASVLYGELRPGGIINLVTKQPTDEFLAEAGVRAGGESLQRFEGDISGPVDEAGKVGVRLNAVYQESDSFRDFQESERTFLAPVVALELGEDTKLTLEGEYGHQNFLATEGIPAQGLFLPNVNGQISDSFWAGDPGVEGDELDTSVLGYRLEHRFTDAVVLRNAFRWERFDLEEASAVPFSLLGDQRTLNRALLTSDETTDDLLFQTDVEAQLQTGPVDHEIVVGFDFRDQEREGTSGIDILNPIDIFNPTYGSAFVAFPFSATEDRIEQDTFGIYAQDRVFIGEDLTLLGGVRYDDTSTQTRTVNVLGGGSVSTTERDDNELSTQFGIVYRPLDGLSLYGNRSESFLPQIGTAAGGSPLEPETALQYEVGVRLDLLDDRLRTNLAVYEVTRENVSTSDPNNPGFQIAVGETESRGFEASVTGEVTESLNLIASYAYTETEITRDNGGTEGNEFLGVPENSASLFGRYNLLDGPLQGLGFSAGIAYVGKRQGDLANSFDLPSYTRVDIGIHFEPSERMQAGLFVENLFDEEYIVASENINRVFPGAPRTVIGEFRMKF